MVGPKTMKSMLEHFPFSKGKSDPQLVWNFYDEEVVLRSLESGTDGKGAWKLEHLLCICCDCADWRRILHY